MPMTTRANARIPMPIAIERLVPCAEAAFSERGLNHTVDNILR